MIDRVVTVSSIRAAEMVKLLENIYRSVNIALVNELKILSELMGIDIWEVIHAASTKPFGYTPFYPGPGLGGHCIPIDPFYLSWKAKEYDFSHMSSTPLTVENLGKFDIVLITTDHSNIDYQWLVDNSGLVVGTRNATKNVKKGARNIVRA